MILIPIGRDESTIQRHAWVSYGIIAANVLMYLATAMMFQLGVTETRSAFNNAISYYAQRPYLTLPPALGDLLAPGFKEKLKKPEIAVPTTQWETEREQGELNALSARAVAAYRRLPNLRFGYIPAEGRFAAMFTSMFVHAGLLHLIGNMLFFWLSGPFVEDVFGRPLFAALYFTGGFAATLTYWIQHPTSTFPLVGASGAIAAVMGAYLVRFFKSKIEFMFIPFWFRPQTNFRFFLPAFVVLPLWFLQQLFDMTVSEAGSGVAFSAHVGGFIYGVAFALVILVTGFEEKHVAPKIQQEISWQIDPRIEAAMAARDKFDFDGAKRAIAPVLREKPGDIDALRTAVDIARVSEDGSMLDNYGTRLLGRLIDSKETDAAIELIRDTTVQIDPSLIPKFTARAAAFVERSGDHDWAMVLYEKALKGDPMGLQAVPSLVKLGSLRKARGDVSGARTALQEARAHPKCTPEWAQSIETRLSELAG
jgi:membrane associated rhomboid family serine protease